MKTGPDLPGRAPDIIFLRNENLGMLKHTYLDGPADLAIEIVSEESRLRDRGEKFAEYEVGGVKEYWIIDPVMRRTDFFLLKKGRYERQVEDVQGIYHSEVIQGFWIKVAWLWDLPPVLDVLRESKPLQLLFSPFKHEIRLQYDKIQMCFAAEHQSIFRNNSESYL